MPTPRKYDRDAETAAAAPQKDDLGRFVVGNAGRPKGSRNRISDAFLKALSDDFDEHGVQTIKTVRDEKPHEYLKIIASLLPKQVEIKEGAFDGISDDELAALVVAARSALGVAEQGGSGDEAAGQSKSIN